MVSTMGRLALVSSTMRLVIFAAVGAVGFDFDAGIFGFEGFDHALYESPASEVYQVDFAFALGAGIEHLLAVLRRYR